MMKAMLAATSQGASCVSDPTLSALTTVSCFTLTVVREVGTGSDSDFQMRKVKLREVGHIRKATELIRAELASGSGAGFKVCR